MWRVAKNPDDYSLYFDGWWKQDLTAMVRQGANHPSIFMWSIGNEEIPRARILAGLDRPTGGDVALTAAALTHAALDLARRGS